MIVINKNEYNNFESKVFYGEYDIHQDNKQRKSDSDYLITYSDKLFNEAKDIYAKRRI